MAVLTILEGWTGVETGGAGRGARFVRRTKRVFSLTTDSPSDRGVFTWPITAGGQTIPARGTAHPDDLRLISGEPQVSKKGPGYYKVEVPYETPDPTDPENREEDPLSQPWEISWDDAERTVPYDRDLAGNPVVNSMDEPFNPPLSRQVSDPVLVIERNEAAFDPDVKLDYQDTVCAEVFWGAAIGRARLARIKARLVTAETPYSRCRYEIVFRMVTPTGTADADAWKRQVLDQGTKYKDASGNTQPSPNGELVLLAADGTRTTAAAPHWLLFVEHQTVSWAGIGINNP